MRLGINGFGRIGRCIIRGIVEKGYNVTYLQVNTSSSVEDSIHMLKYDSAHGILNAKIEIINKTSFKVNNIEVEIFSERNLDNITWNNIDIVMECTGAFKKKSDLEKHIKNGAKGVILSCPSSDDNVKTIVFGANEEDISGDLKIISIGSCTTNALAPVTKVIHENFKIEKGFISTVHSYTSDQNLLDNKHKDLRRGRSAAVSIVPTSTGATNTMQKIIPSLKGKLSGAAIRVPTQNVSVIDCVFTVNKKTTKEEINSVIKKYSNKSKYNALTFTEDPVVSIDLNHNPYSSIVDLLETKMVEEDLVRILIWYDNEWAFSLRMLDASVKILNI